MMSQGPSQSTAVAMGLALGGLRGHRPLDSAFLRSWVGDGSPQGRGQRALNPRGQDEMRSERRERLQGSAGHGTGLRAPRRSSRGQSSSKSSQICAGDLLRAGHWGHHTGQNPCPPRAPSTLSYGRVRLWGLGLGLMVGATNPKDFPTNVWLPRITYGSSLRCSACRPPRPAFSSPNTPLPVLKHPCVRMATPGKPLQGSLRLQGQSHVSLQPLRRPALVCRLISCYFPPDLTPRPNQTPLQAPEGATLPLPKPLCCMNHPKGLPPSPPGSPTPGPARSIC